MGIKIFSNSSGPWSGPNIGFSKESSGPVTKIINYFASKKTKRDGNPNKYNIARFEQFYQGLAVEINYPDCYNHKGNKILVYDDAEKFWKLHNNKCIDPHFLEESYSPVARFEPTTKGW